MTIKDDPMLLRLLNPPKRLLRVAIKATFVAIVFLLVLYPNPAYLFRHAHRAMNLSSLIEPDAPGIAELAAQTKAAAGPHAQTRATLAAVQAVVYRALPYRHDWETWGAVNYFPTVAEALARGECDCKGRAVVAASVLARLGFKPRLVSDFTHVWVWTPEGESMSPKRTASGRRLIDASEVGNRVDVRALFSTGGMVTDLPAGAAYGLSVFPPIRTGVMLAAFWLIWLPARPRAWAAAAALGAMAGGVFLVGWAGSGSEADPWSLTRTWSGIVLVLAGVVVAARSARRASEAADRRANPACV